MSVGQGAATLRVRVAVVAMLAVLTSTCASKSPTAPSDSKLALSTPTRSVSVNGTAVLTAELLGAGGQPMVGASVAFTTTIGTIAPPQVVTNGAGQATAVYSAGDVSGTAVISASSGEVRASPVNLVVGTAAVGRIALTASPPSVPFAGGNSTITVVVTDAAGNPLNAMPVAFTTTTGNLTPANAKTDTNGTVQTTLTTAASAVVTAVAGSSPASSGGTSTASLTGSVTVPLAERPIPAVSITASDSPVARTPTTFTIGATPAPGANTTIQNVSVDFGDGDVANLGAVSGAAMVAQHVYADGGTYTVSVTATDSAGAAATASTVVVVGATAPIAVSVVAGPMVPPGGGPNAIVTFTATVVPSSSVINSYVWDFDDGSAVQETTVNQVQHVFARTGLYTVSVTATEALTGLTGIGSVPVSTASGMPTVSVTPAANPVAGRSTIFTIAAAVAQGSNVNMQSVQVTFGDGTAPVDLGGVTGNAITVGHVYASAGTYLVEVTATDSGTGTATASTQVVVAAPGAPTVSLTASPNPVAGVATTFTITAAPAAGSNIQNVQMTFGDGTAPVNLGAVSGSTTTQHVYAAAGTYTVSVIVTDGGGGTATAATQVVVTAPGAPTVSVTASANPVSGSVTTFTIAAAPAPGSNSTIQNVRVTFGDGSAPVDLGAVSVSTTTQHVYAASGTYGVSAIATAGNGVTATASTQVAVAAPSAPTVSVTASANAVSGSVTTFTIAAAPAPGSNATIQNVRVTFGDGTAPVDLGAVSGSTTSQHVYAAGGTYTVAATATASNGGTATASTQVAVAAPGAPSVSVTASANPVAGNTTTLTINAAPAPGSNATIQNVRVMFGDGTAPVDLGAVSGSTSTQHAYAAAGTYTVSATATASNGGTATASTQAVVAPRPSPSVSIATSANPVSARATTFTINASPAPGSNTTIQNVRVTFGDGTSADLGAISATATTQHVYVNPGTYPVSATATDTGNATATANTTVVVVAPATVSLAASANAVAGSPTQLTVTVVPVTGVTIQNVSLDYGDSVVEQLGPVSGAPVAKSHTYATGGTFKAITSVSIVAGTTPLLAFTTVVVAPCGVINHTFSILSTVINALHAWPDGQQTFAPTPGCSVTIAAPSGTISLLSGDTWRIVRSVGRTSCTIAPKVPTCRGVGSSSGLQANLRPYCSNAAATVFDRESTATAVVECK